MTDPFRHTTLRLFFFTVLGLLTMILLGGGVVALMAQHYGLAIGQDGVLFDTVADRQHLRLILLVNNLATFGLSAALALWLTYRDRWNQAAGLVRPVRPGLIWPSIWTFVIGLPLIGLVAYLNLQIPLPDWMVRSEATGNTMLAGVLTFDQLPELLLALLTVAVVPALCEELMFRGLLQGRLLSGIMSEHAAVWAAAVVFSAIHVEFAGFMPRLLLGALLGYAYRWTGSLWIPILLHLLFNGIQVGMTYADGEFTPDTEMDTSFIPLLIVGSLSMAATGYLVYRNERSLPEQ
ncbi:hypothetical protein LEM8419_03053 [Neolewinella maritima]|uniref:CAAX prenyl protease 2/Lysostaphin resistance protein A-like domain-containing protein n=1 Tax=Neolewinella maritima TaxID=1383882 RepID=A0ABM9B469_9BACT|nr:CPBP family intramembrane glutamic endopeptidase [Neolewinella maritima]CAH1002136.1 hypothetical protein LEM8419_03053 [Neolewinella maritima]